MRTEFKIASAVGAAALSFLSAPALADPSTPPEAWQSVRFPEAEKISFGEWPLEYAHPDAVEAMFRYQLAQTIERFGDTLDFVCLGYSYGEPTAEFLERFADVTVSIQGRYACSPERNQDKFSVLLALSTIRCNAGYCSAKSAISFGDTIEPSVPISAGLSPDGWAIESNETAE